MSRINWSIGACGVFLLWAMAAVALPAQTATGVLPAPTAAIAPTVTFTTLLNFNGTEGGNPYAGLVQGTDGNFYGTTVIGGAYVNNCGGFGCGTVFKITPDGTLTTLYSFCAGGGGCADGATPYGGLVEGTDGNYYGTTYAGGGEYGCGTVFKITPTGALRTLYSFCPQTNCPDGESPHAGLVQGLDRKFYGTTFAGGSSVLTNCGIGCGTVFSITSSGELTTLYNFCSQSGCADGVRPYAGLVLGTDGSFYGTTYAGGATEDGTVFKITPGGTLTTLHSFDITDGLYPEAGLIQGADGSFYGTTYQGGDSNEGTVFTMTPSGTLTTLHSFDGTDGRLPEAALVLGTDGNFYGTTAFGGGIGSCVSQNCGTVFTITPSGTLTTLHSFDVTDGSEVYSPVLQGTNGTFYGTTYYGGFLGGCIAGCGTVFSLSVGLGPFVETLPASGKVGMAVKILGTTLTAATKVTFHGVAADFKVISSSEIATTVPTGATTGSVKVITPTGTLSSNVPFTVN